MADVETIIVGAGVIGLAIARQLALADHEVVVLERHGLIGSEISARNSEVIHAGIYYPADSLKARLCVAGKKLLYEYCASHRVNHARCGKLIVATDDTQLGALEDIKSAAARNGVEDLTWLGAAHVQALEPQLTCVAALHSPSTGIIDSHGLMLSLQGELEAHGGNIAFHANLINAVRHQNGEYVLAVDGDDFSGYALTCKNLIIAAGLESSNAASGLFQDGTYTPPATYYAKGNYYSLQGAAPFSRLIYPVPEPGGLGVHMSLDLAGEARFGPDVEWVNELDYAVDPERANFFYTAIRRYWPNLPDGALSPDYSGIRPKLSRQGEPAADFTIHGPKTHGRAGLICLYGIESPGLTSSLAIAENVGAQL